MDVVVWLRSLGLGKYEAVFRENDIDETVSTLATGVKFVRPYCKGQRQPKKLKSHDATLNLPKLADLGINKTVYDVNVAFDVGRAGSFAAKHLFPGWRRR
jgi:hypothetical protein